MLPLEPTAVQTVDATGALPTTAAPAADAGGAHAAWSIGTAGPVRATTGKSSKTTGTAGPAAQTTGSVALATGTTGSGQQSPGSGAGVAQAPPAGSQSNGGASNAPAANGPASNSQASPSAPATGPANGSSTNVSSPTAPASTPRSVPNSPPATAAIAAAARTQPSAGAIAQAIAGLGSYVHSPIKPTASEVSVLGGDVCTAFDQGATSSQVQAALLQKLGGIPFTTVLPGAANYVVSTAVSLYCPSYSSKLG